MKYLVLLLLLACSKDIEPKPFYGEWKRSRLSNYKECRSVLFQGKTSEECRDLPPCVDTPPPLCPVIVPRCEECPSCGYNTLTVQGYMP